MIAECGMGKLESGGAPTSWQPKYGWMYVPTYIRTLGILVAGDGHDTE